MITHINYMSTTSNKNYLFEITEENGWFLAKCDKKIGGLNTCAKSWNRLVGVMIPDCVETWEEV